MQVNDWAPLRASLRWDSISIILLKLAIGYSPNDWEVGSGPSISYDRPVDSHLSVKGARAVSLPRCEMTTSAHNAEVLGGRVEVTVRVIVAELLGVELKPFVRIKQKRTQVVARKSTYNNDWVRSRRTVRTLTTVDKVKRVTSEGANCEKGKSSNILEKHVVDLSG